MSTSARRYNGVTAEERQAARRRNLMDAALRVIGDEGWNAATVRRVSADAGVGPRFFYESFTDMTDLATTVYEELSRRILARAVVAIAAAPVDVDSKARAAAASVVGDFTDDPVSARFLFSDAPALSAHKRDHVRMVAEEIARQGRYAGVRAIGDRQLLATSLMIATGSTELILATVNGALDLTATELTELFANTLTVMAKHMPPTMSDD